MSHRWQRRLPRCRSQHRRRPPIPSGLCLGPHLQRHPGRREGWSPSFLCAADKRVCRNVHERSSSTSPLRLFLRLEDLVSDAWRVQLGGYADVSRLDGLNDKLREGSSVNPLIQGEQAVAASLRVCAHQEVRQDPPGPRVALLTSTLRVTMECPPSSSPGHLVQIPLYRNTGIFQECVYERLSAAWRCQQLGENRRCHH